MFGRPWVAGSLAGGALVNGLAKVKGERRGGVDRSGASLVEEGGVRD